MSSSQTPQVSYYSALLASAVKGDDPDLFSSLHDQIGSCVSQTELHTIEEECRKFSELNIFVLKSKIKWLETHGNVKPLSKDNNQQTIKRKNRDIENLKNSESEVKVAESDAEISAEATKNLVEEFDKSILKLHQHKENLEKVLLKTDMKGFAAQSPEQDTNNNVRNNKTVLEKGIQMTTFSKIEKPIIKSERKSNVDIFKTKYPELKTGSSVQSVKDFSLPQHMEDTVINIGLEDEQEAGEKLPRETAFSSNPLFSNWNDCGKNATEFSVNSNGDGSNGDADGNITDKKRKKKKKRKNKSDTGTEDAIEPSEGVNEEVVDKTEGTVKSSRSQRRKKLKAVRKKEEQGEEAVISPEVPTSPVAQPTLASENGTKRKKRTIKAFKKELEEKEKEKQRHFFTPIITSRPTTNDAMSDDSERTPLLPNSMTKNTKPDQEILYLLRDPTTATTTTGTKTTTKKEKKKDKRKVGKKSSNGKNSTAEKSASYGGVPKNDTKQKKNDNSDSDEIMQQDNSVDSGISFTQLQTAASKETRSKPDNEEEKDDDDEGSYSKVSRKGNRFLKQQNNWINNNQRGRNLGNSSYASGGASGGKPAPVHVPTSLVQDSWPLLNEKLERFDAKKEENKSFSYASKVKSNLTQLDSAGCSIASSSEDSSSSSSSSSGKAGEENFNENLRTQKDFAGYVTNTTPDKEELNKSSKDKPKKGSDKPVQQNPENISTIPKKKKKNSTETSANLTHDKTMLPENQSNNTVSKDFKFNDELLYSKAEETENNFLNANNKNNFTKNVSKKSESKLTETAGTVIRSKKERITDLSCDLQDVFKNKWGLEFFDVSPTKKFDCNELLLLEKSMHNDNVFCHINNPEETETQSIIIGTVSVDEKTQLNILKNTNMQNDEDCDLLNKIPETEVEKFEENQAIIEDATVSTEQRTITSPNINHLRYTEEDINRDAASYNYHSSIKFLIKEWSEVQSHAILYEE